ncbi:Zinc finger, CCCH-type [Dillenia turbinata]|uniref:Zinc finger, CCCH-type n=1 Tax=Dillenia turbinata TaxID=194707 RepID=A0AAN8WJN9_9MAGN
MWWDREIMASGKPLANLIDKVSSIQTLMSYSRNAGLARGGDVVHIIPETTPGNGVVENWNVGSVDPAMWATEDDYGVWNEDVSNDSHSNSIYDGRQSQTRSGSEPPNKKPRSSQTVDSQGSGFNRSKAIGKMFFKTKLCCKFRAGTCPYVMNCNFAHSIEELRRPPPDWPEIVASHDGDCGASSEPRVEFQIPILGSSNYGGESQRSYKGRHCRKFVTEEGCPYGDSCTSLHDEQLRTRESVAISLGPGSGSGYGGEGSSGLNLKPSNWKTRICNKWELTGYCPFGNKCHFAHGIEGSSNFLFLCSYNMQFP